MQILHRRSTQKKAPKETIYWDQTTTCSLVVIPRLLWCCYYLRCLHGRVSILTYILNTTHRYTEVQQAHIKEVLQKGLMFPTNRPTHSWFTHMVPLKSNHAPKTQTTDFSFQDMDQFMHYSPTQEAREEHWWQNGRWCLPHGRVLLTLSLEQCPVLRSHKCIILIMYVCRSHKCFSYNVMSPPTDTAAPPTGPQREGFF